MIRLLWLPLMLIGCVSLPRDIEHLKEPTVTLTGLTLADANLWKPTFRLDLAVDNPNDLALQVDAADVVLHLNGQAVAEGTSLSPLTLIERGRSRLKMNASAHTLAVAQQLLTLEGRDALDYRIVGHLQIMNWLGGLGRLPFQYDGRISREELMRGARGLGP